MQYYRDEEKRDLCLSYLNGISVFQFGLSLNVSTLNRWQPRPLVLSGYWKDTNPEIDIGADVAAGIVEESPARGPDFVRTLSEPIPEVGGLGYVRRGLLNEDEALKLILQSSPVTFSPDTSSALGLTSSKEAEAVQKEDGPRKEVPEDVQDSHVENCDVQPELKMYSSFIEEDVTEPVIDLEWDNPVVEPLTTLSPCLAEELELTVEDKYDQEEEVVVEEEEEVIIENIDKPESVEEEEAGEESVPGSPVSDGSSNLSLRESPVSRPNLVLRPDLTAGLPGRVPGSPVSDGSSNLLHVMSFAETTTLQLLVSRVSWSG